MLVLAAAPLVYYALATLVALRFFKRERARVLPDFTPSVSILKPVRGVDFGSYENFASFCRQEYPDYEILFAVNDDSDPAVAVINRIIAEFPEQRIRLLVGAEHLGANRKVNKLARLAGEAQNEVLVLTDGDVRVGPNFLREVVAPLADKKVSPSRSELPLPRPRSGLGKWAASRLSRTRLPTTMNSVTALLKPVAKSSSRAKLSGPCIPPKPFAAFGTIKCAGPGLFACAGRCPMSDFFLRKGFLGVCSPH